MEIYEVLQSTKLPCAYSHFKKKQTPPFLVYIGTGQDDFAADNTYYHKNNRYRVEYYFTAKDEEKEAAIESALLAAGLLYEKSDDIYIESEDVFVIYYDV